MHRTLKEIRKETALKGYEQAIREAEMVAKAYQRNGNRKGLLKKLREIRILRRAMRDEA